MDMEVTVKPSGAAIIIQLIYTGMFVMSKAAFDQGMNTYIFIFYRQAAGSVLLLPIALIQWKNAPSMSPLVLLKLFFCALIGITLGVNLYDMSLKFTSPTVASAADSSLPAITFFLAVLSRMEVVKLKGSSGIAKITSVALCLSGVFSIAFFTGPSLNPVNHHHAISSHPSPHSNPIVSKGLWITWTSLMLLANIVWSLWMVLQAAVLKDYPNSMIVTVAQCMFSTVQSFIVAVIAERDFSRWKLRFDFSLLAILYNSFMVTGVSYYLQAWCIQKKGPIFFTAWTPLCLVFTIFCPTFFLGEIVHLGSIVGGILLIGSLYSMMWGKTKECKIDDGIHDIEKDQHKESFQDELEQTKTEAKYSTVGHQL